MVQGTHENWGRLPSHFSEIWVELSWWDFMRSLALFEA